MENFFRLLYKATQKEIKGIYLIMQMGSPSESCMSRDNPFLKLKGQKQSKDCIGDIGHYVILLKPFSYSSSQCHAEFIDHRPFIGLLESHIYPSYWPPKTTVISSS